MRGQGLLRVLFANPVTKLVSLVLATFLWLYVNAALSEERAFDVPIAKVEAPEGFMPMGEAPRTVRVKLRAERVA